MRVGMILLMIYQMKILTVLWTFISEDESSRDESTEEVSPKVEETTEELVTIDDEKLREVVTDFVDGIIKKAVVEYNSIQEEKIEKIPSTDDLYEKSLEAHLEREYEYTDEISHEISPEKGDDVDEAVSEGKDFRRHLKNLRDACMEFVDEMNGHEYLDESDDESEDTVLGYLDEVVTNIINSERPHVEELKRNCASLKTSYNLVKNRMTEFYLQRGSLLSLVIYGMIFYTLILR